MINSLRVLCLLVCSLMLQACGPDPEERYDYGYNDGHATGYNTVCEIRSTMVDADWSNKDYTRGFQQGYSDGSAMCLKSKLEDIENRLEELE